MSMQPVSEHSAIATDATAIQALYQQLLASWNNHDGAAFAALFTADGESIGFDGSQLIGPADIAVSLGAIFAQHVTAPYVGKIHNVRLLSADVAILRAIAGMVPVGQTQINPQLNAVHTLVAVKHDDQWRIALFQNTPAQFHGRPEEVQRLTEELQALLPVQ